MAIDDDSEDAGQVAMRLGFVQLTGLDEGREHGPVLGDCVMAREERVFALQGDGADCALHGALSEQNLLRRAGHPFSFAG